MLVVDIKVVPQSLLLPLCRIVRARSRGVQVGGDEAQFVGIIDPVKLAFGAGKIVGTCGYSNLTRGSLWCTRVPFDHASARVTV